MGLYEVALVSTLRRFKKTCGKEGKAWGEELGLIDIGETLTVQSILRVPYSLVIFLLRNIDL